MVLIFGALKGKQSMSHRPAQTISPQLPTFGLEVEFLLVKADTFAPLWYRDLDFSVLHDHLAAIHTQDLLGDHSPLQIDPPHKFNSPYVIEGYHMPGGSIPPYILPKGVEIRTPVSTSIEGVITNYRILLSRLVTQLLPLGLRPVAMSHHPIHTHFDGPQDGREPKFWGWAKQAMCTYGPDFNLSLPKHWLKTPDRELMAKLYYYSPAIAALSANSPFANGEPWQPRGERGVSLRMHRRSQYGPTAILHSGNHARLEYLEYKDLEMTANSKDLTAYFYLLLGMLLQPDLRGRADQSSRSRELLMVAQYGLALDVIRYKIDAVLKGATRALITYGYNPKPLERLWHRLETRVTPADQLISVYQGGNGILGCMRYLASEIEHELI